MYLPSNRPMCDMTGSISGGNDVIPPDLLAKGNG